MREHGIFGHHTADNDQQAANASEASIGQSGAPARYDWNAFAGAVDALLQGRYAGLRSVEIDGRRVAYATDAEMATALADLERRITSAQSGKVRQVRIQSTKGA